MKKDKIKLENLKVHSFITDHSDNKARTVVGGATNGVAGCFGPDANINITHVYQLCDNYNPDIYPTDYCGETVYIMCPIGQFFSGLETCPID